MEKRETQVEDVLLPVEFVTLTGKGLKTKGGEPIVVRVEFVDEGTLIEATEALPGYQPQIGPKQKVDQVAVSKQIVKLAPQLIAASCVLVRADGSEVRPAFYFGDDPKNGALPGRFLSYGDKLRLVLTLLRICGFVGGAADKVRFRDGDGEGSTGSGGGVDAGGSDRRTPRRAVARKAQG